MGLPDRGRGELITLAGETAALRTRHGAQVTLAGASRVDAITADEHHDQVVLARGSVHVQVPSLGAGKTFSVRTPDALVTVHGTTFQVSVSGAAGSTQTCVQVTEGVVSVVRGGAPVLLRAGGQFNCAESATPKASPAAAPAEDGSLPKSAERAAERASPREPASSTNQTHAASAGASAAGASADATLGEQNRLLAAALQAERAGNYAEARGLLRELLARYPSSALVPDAQRSLERVQRRLP